MHGGGAAKVTRVAVELGRRAVEGESRRAVTWKRGACSARASCSWDASVLVVISLVSGPETTTAAKAVHTLIAVRGP